jgi:uncharacterized protein (TIGR02145 family)
MKTIKIFAYISFLTFILGCSPNNDSNNDPNNDPSGVPLAPSNLTGVASTTQVNLSWTDNSSNETEFKIERKSGSGNYVVVGTSSADYALYDDLSITPNTTYTYRVCSNNSFGNSVTYSNELTLTTISLPNVYTTAVSSITANSAVSGGDVVFDGGTTIIARGVCWSTSINPTIALSTKTNNGGGTGVFTSTISGLTSNTVYYLRAYASNSSGTNYGAEVSFTAVNPPITSVTDVDGNTYQLVTICNQTWTQSNLNVSKYRNGDVIPQVTDDAQWESLTTGAWCYQNNNSSNGGTYGKLYNWYAVTDPRGLAPAGFHIPTDTEWTTLTDCLVTNKGGKMKSTGTMLWAQPNFFATNESGFTGHPGGNRWPAPNDSFSGTGYDGYWWSSVEYQGTYAWTRKLNYVDGGVYRAQRTKKEGLSVRCIKD